MADIKDVVIKIKADNSDFKRKMKDSGNVAREESDKINKSFLAIKAGAAAAALAVGAIAVKGIKDYALAEKATLRLEAVLKATGQSAGFTAAQITALADQMEATSFFTAEQVQESAAIMATFRKVTGDTFEEAIKLAADLSVVYGTDLRSATVQVGKALQNPIEGITALKRVGVELSEEQKTQIDNFIEINDLAGAQGVILGELAAQVGGASAGQAGGLAGAYDNLSDTIGMVVEDIGGFIARGLQLQELFGSLTEAVGEFRLGLMQLGIAEGSADFFEKKLRIVNSEIDKSLGKISKLKELNSGLSKSFIRAESEKINELLKDRIEIQKKLDATGAGGLIGPTQPPQVDKSTLKGGSDGKSATKRLNEELRQQKTILDAIKTPQQEYADKLSVAESLLSQNLLTMEQFNLYQEKLADDFKKTGEQAETTAKIIQDKFGDALENAAFDFENFGDSARSVLEGLARDLARKNIIDPFTTAVTGALSTSDVFGSLANDLFGGFFADGGNPPVGKVSVVGERGPELFVPRTAGTIIPNGGMGGGNVTVNVVNNSQSQVGVSQSRSSNGKSIEIQIDELTAQNILTQGTRTNSAIGAISGNNIPRI